MVTKYTPVKIKAAAKIFTVFTVSLPISIAKTPAITGCIYKNVLTVDALSFVSANGFKRYVPKVAPTITNSIEK